MKQCSSLIFSLLISLFTMARQKGAAENPREAGIDYSIATWPGFKRSALTITFDDNYRFQVTKALPFLNEHHYKATWFIVTNRVGKGWAPGWDTLNMLALQGHEIASHSVNHPDFVTLSLYPQYADSMRNEFDHSRTTINSHISCQTCETFAWPFGSVSPACINVAKNYYMACRGSSNGYERNIPENQFNIYSQHIYHDTPLNSVNRYVDDILSAKGWLVERWHGFKAGQDTNGYEPVPIEVFQAHMDYIAMHDDSVWTAPLNTVMKYIEERERTELHLISTTSSEMILGLTNSLPDTLYHYNVPLSIRIRFDDAVKGLGFITQNNHAIPFTIRNFNGISYYCFDAVPNLGLIHLLFAPDGAFGIEPGQERSTGNYPNPFAMSTSIYFLLSNSEFVTIRVFNSKGSPVLDFSGVYSPGKNLVVADGKDLPPGEYICMIEISGKTSFIRMVRS
jgi:peptidoglycan/xylan/chitin deacetylase (PgdA/CDA1 family)